MRNKFTRASGSEAARARWQNNALARAGEPVRETRVVEMTIRDSHRPGVEVRMESHETPSGWGRWRVAQNGKQVGRRTFGHTAISAMLAKVLQ